MLQLLEVARDCLGDLLVHPVAVDPQLLQRGCVPGDVGESAGTCSAVLNSEPLELELSRCLGERGQAFVAEGVSS